MSLIIFLFYSPLIARSDAKPATINNTAAGATAATPPRSVWGPPSQASTEPSVIPKPIPGPPAQASAEASTVRKPAWGQSSQNSVPVARSSSAFPVLNESMRSLSVDTASSSAKEPRSQSVRQGNRRRVICSAVPDTAVLTPIRRPDDGGSKGQTISVYTNHFRVDIDDAVVNQYDIDIALIDRDGRPRLARKDDRWNVIKSVINDKKKNFPAVW
jgi:hypothetical protein